MKFSATHAVMALSVLVAAGALAFLSQNRDLILLLPGTEPDHQMHCWNTPVGETGRKQVHLFFDLEEAYPGLENEIKSLKDSSEFTPAQRQHLCALVQQEQVAKELAQRS